MKWNPFGRLNPGLSTETNSRVSETELHDLRKKVAETDFTSVSSRFENAFIHFPNNLFAEVLKKIFTEAREAPWTGGTSGLVLKLKLQEETWQKLTAG